MAISKVCYFGAYELDYPHNQILRKGLALHDIEVVECRVTTVGLKAVQRAARLEYMVGPGEISYQGNLMQMVGEVANPCA
jgi:hypothetical protein